MQTPSLEEKKSTIINVLYYSLIIAVAFLGLRLVLRYLLPALYPFAIAYALSFVLNPIMHYLKRKLGLPKGVGAFLLVTAAVAVVFGLAYIVIHRAALEIGRLSTYLSSLSAEELQPFKQQLLAFFKRIPFVNGEKLWQSAGERLQTLITDSLPSVKGTLSMATGLFTGILDFLLTFVITVVSCYYMTVDRARVSAFFYKLCPQSAAKYLRSARVEVFGALGKYLKAYGIIILITFTELFAAFTVLRLEYALLLAVVIAVVDILPVLGTGTILIPWGLVCLFITRNFYLGAGLIIAYIVITILRQIIEPKIVGGYIGLHPLATMVTMFAGLKLFGIVGMLLFPFAVLIARNIIAGKKAEA